MELRHNLLQKKEKSNFKLAIGIVSLLVAIALFIVKMTEESQFPLFDWFFCFFCAINGLYYLTNGWGYPPEGFFGKAFIEINETHISIKKTIIKKEQSIRWTDMLSVRREANTYQFRKTDGNIFVLNLSEFDYKLVQQIKEAIESFAGKKLLL